MARLAPYVSVLASLAALFYSGLKIRAWFRKKDYDPKEEQHG